MTREKLLSQDTDNLQEELQRLNETLREAAKSLASVILAFRDGVRAICQGANFTQLLKAAKVQAALNEAPPRVRHLAKHGKKYRTRKKNLNRALREYERRQENGKR
jgi:hypothetical protein